MRLGIDRILVEPDLKKTLRKRRLAVVGHPASVTTSVLHSLDAICQDPDFNVTAAFGPQHGMRGEKQENMIESDTYQDPFRKIPVFSLYGELRKPSAEMLSHCDVVLFDLQDIGCRIYTYLTTLLYIMEACAENGKELWVLDRPNPAGRPIEGNLLLEEWKTFVGATAVPMRHGLTLGELANWMKHHHKINVEMRVIAMEGYDPTRGRGWGWPEENLSWVNPSPNIPTLTSTRTFAGTVLLEGTNISEARGTTRPLEMLGAPNMNAEAIWKEMQRFEPRWLVGCGVRPCYFEPMFHKFAGQLCSGFQIHADGSEYNHESFKPFRWIHAFFKALNKVHPGMLVWKQPPYEYENIRLPVDILNGSDQPRLWVDDPRSTAGDLESVLSRDEKYFREARKPFLLYPDDK